MKSKYLTDPVDPFEVRENLDVSGLLDAMGGTAFQARNLGTALDVWIEMLRDDALVFLGLAGAMVPAGMRRVVAWLLRNRCVDCLVSTGANLFHDIHETLGRHHYKGRTNADDEALRDARVDRIHDVFASEEEFNMADRYIARWAETLDLEKKYSTREFLRLLGERLARDTEVEGILTSAAAAKVPVYCPALSDSSIGIALAVETEKTVTFDMIADIRETADLVLQTAKTGVVYVSGGTPKNFIQQAEVTASFVDPEIPGHSYAVQVTADAPHWGGLSGCTFEEAQSWGKIAKGSRKVTVHCDSTIALPLLATGLAQRAKDLIARRKAPDMDALLAAGELAKRGRT